MREDVAERFLVSADGILGSDGDDLWALTRAGKLDPREDLQHSDLRGIDCSGEDLTGFDLTGADLSGANLAAANLVGVSLAQANLTDANLTGANLRRVDLSNAQVSGASFAKAILREANLRGVDCTRADFSNADFNDAMVDDALIVGRPDRRPDTESPNAAASYVGAGGVAAQLSAGYRVISDAFGQRAGLDPRTTVGPAIVVGLLGLGIGAVIGAVLPLANRRAHVVDTRTDATADEAANSVDEVRQIGLEAPSVTADDNSPRPGSEMDAMQ